MNRSGPTRQFVIADIMKASHAPQDVVVQVVNYHYYRVPGAILDWVYYYQFFSHLLLREVKAYITACYLPFIKRCKQVK